MKETETVFARSLKDDQYLNLPFHCHYHSFAPQLAHTSLQGPGTKYSLHLSWLSPYGKMNKNKMQLAALKLCLYNSPVLTQIYVQFNTCTRKTGHRRTLPKTEKEKCKSMLRCKGAAEIPPLQKEVVWIDTCLRHTLKTN